MLLLLKGGVIFFVFVSFDLKPFPKRKPPLAVVVVVVACIEKVVLLLLLVDRGQKYDDESTREGQKFLGENERGVILCGGVGPKDTHSTAATLFFVWSKDDSFFWQSSAVVLFGGVAF